MNNNHLFVINNSDLTNLLRIKRLEIKLEILKANLMKITKNMVLENGQIIMAKVQLENGKMMN